MPPTRYTVVVPDEMRFRLRGEPGEWETELAEYFLDVVRENGWSAVSHPMVRIVFDPALKGGDIRVAVDESYLLHRGQTVPRRTRGSVLSTVLVSSAMLLACAYLLALLAVPGLLPSGFSVPGGVQSAWSSAGDRVDSWWDAARARIAGAFESRPSQASGESREGGDATRGVVTASPWLTVRAGSPSRSGAVHPNVHFPQGMELQWSPSQVVQGESINGEDRWIEVGTAGPEWGDREGQPLYVWMGGLRLQG